MSDKSAAQRFFGYLLMAVGGLMMVLCGGCTLLYLGAGIRSWLASPDDLYYAQWSHFIIIASLIIGGLPTGIGLALFVIGRGMKRRADSRGRDVVRPLSLKE
jgi:hypothetical protein